MLVKHNWSHKVVRKRLISQKGNSFKLLPVNLKNSVWYVYV